MTKDLLLALDQGTTSSRAIVFGVNGEILAQDAREYPQLYPREGWVEHNPADILTSQTEAARSVFRRSGIDPRRIAAVGISNQRETVVVWDKTTGQPVHNAIVWQCRRTAPQCDVLKKAGLEEKIRSATGLVVDAYFSATKIAWILNNVPGAREKAEAGQLLCGTVDTWLLWNFTAGRLHATDYTNASRTMLFNIHRLCWDKDLLDLFKIPAAMLPQVMRSWGKFGALRADFVPGMDADITGVCGDQQAALFGQGCLEPGSIKNTYGTGCFVLQNTGEKPAQSKQGLLTTLTAQTSYGKPVYALEGSVFAGGAAVQWLRDGLKLIEKAAETEALAKSVPDTDGVIFVPAFTGLGAPYWDMYARGTISGITRGTRREHIVRAALEAIAFQSLDVIEAMRLDSGQSVPAIRVDGGASANNFLMQFQADISGCRVIRLALQESTAWGAAALAGLGAEVWRASSDIFASRQPEKHFTPRIPARERARLVTRWQKAVAKVCS